MMLEKLAQDALIIWAAIDPLGTMALFTALTARMSPADRRRTAFKAILYAGAVLMGRQTTNIGSPGEHCLIHQPAG